MTIQEFGQAIEERLKGRVTVTGSRLGTSLHPGGVCAQTFLQVGTMVEELTEDAVETVVERLSPLLPARVAFFQDLPVPLGVNMSYHTPMGDGFKLRVVQAHDVTFDTFPTRVDLMIGLEGA